jgi:hypothetical protein
MFRSFRGLQRIHGEHNDPFEHFLCCTYRHAPGTRPEKPERRSGRVQPWPNGHRVELDRDYLCGLLVCGKYVELQAMQGNLTRNPVPLFPSWATCYYEQHE